MPARNVADDPLYPELVERLGQETAMDLLQRLPPPGDVATRQDVREVGGRVGALEHRMGALEQRIDAFEQRVTRQMERFDDKLERFHEALREQTRNVLLANAAMMLTLAAILVAVGLVG